MMIGGCTSTPNLQAASESSIPAAGITAYAWAGSFSNELDVFQTWAKVYPGKVSLLVDTYDVSKSRVPNAIRIFKQVSTQGHQPVGIRIDSDDALRLAIKAREMFDDAGFPKAKITASDAPSVYVVKSPLGEGASTDNSGIGERLITSSSSPALNGVYKLAEEKINDQWIPKTEVSDSRERAALPGNKQAYRIYWQGSLHQAIADMIALADEHITAPLKVVNANSVVTHASQVLTSFDAKPLMQECLGSNTSPAENDPSKVRQFLTDQVAELPEATKQLVNPDRYLIYLTATLAELQEQLVTKAQFTEEH